MDLGTSQQAFLNILTNLVENDRRSFIDWLQGSIIPQASEFDLHNINCF